MTEVPTVSVEPTAADRWRSLLRQALSLRWVPLTVALLSLPLSATALLLSVQQPEVLMIMPDQIRVAQGRLSGASYVYLQPAFVSTGRNDRVEVIRDMTLEVTPPDGGQAVEFVWTEVLRLVTDATTGGLKYEYVADAAPILVGPRDAATPLSLFHAPPNWFFAPGTYTFRLVAPRVVTRQDLTGSFTVTLSQADISTLEEPGTEKFLTIPIATPRT